MSQVEEIHSKMALLRKACSEAKVDGIRIRGSDWFSWLTGGGSNTVLLCTEVGVAEILVTADRAVVLCGVNEAERLLREQVPESFEIRSNPWQDLPKRESWVRELVGDRVIASDRPTRFECALPPTLVTAKRRLLPGEVERYRALARDAAEAMTETLKAVQPYWTEWELVGRGAENLWKRGIHPTSTLAAGEERLMSYRHPVAAGRRIGGRAMLVFCARRHGLFANLTRFVQFHPLTEEQCRLLSSVAAIENIAWLGSQAGTPLNEIYNGIAAAYEREGFAGEVHSHHQGGLTGYLAREVVANPDTSVVPMTPAAYTWNPTLPGMKIEDTILCQNGKIEVLTLDSNWPSFSHAGRQRPDVFVKVGRG